MIVSREDARQIGLKRFFTGLACGRGHVVERLVSDGHCVACKKLRDEKRHAKRLEYMRAWLKENENYHVQYREKNKDKTLLWRTENKERLADLKREWACSNRAKRNASNMLRYATQMRATPVWADADSMRSYYETAIGLGMLLGEWYEVDHIVPLQSKFVCGLHCASNLRVIPAIENSSKGNRYWPDMP
jgi:hypothetical protein